MGKVVEDLEAVAARAVAVVEAVLLALQKKKYIPVQNGSENELRRIVLFHTSAVVNSTNFSLSVSSSVKWESSSKKYLTR